jgi:general stress protein 26
MTDLSDDKDVEKRMWKEIERGRYGMLGLVNVSPPQHFQPMTAFCEPDVNQILFYTSDETDLAKAIAEGGSQAMFTLTSKDQELQACISGKLSLDRDPTRIEKHWNAVVSAWFPQGKSDPHLTLLRLDLEDAAVWLSEKGPVRFAFEIARANLADRQPDVGGRTEISFN